MHKVISEGSPHGSIETGLGQSVVLNRQTRRRLKATSMTRLQRLVDQEERLDKVRRAVRPKVAKRVRKGNTKRNRVNRRQKISLVRIPSSAVEQFIGEDRD